MRWRAAALIAIAMLGVAGRPQAADVKWDETTGRISVVAQGEAVAGVLAEITARAPGVRVRWLRPDGAELITVNLQGLDLRGALSRVLADRNHVLTQDPAGDGPASLDVWVGSPITGRSAAAPAGIAAHGLGGHPAAVPLPPTTPPAGPANSFREQGLQALHQALEAGADPEQLSQLAASLGPEAQSLVLRQIAERTARGLDPAFPAGPPPGAGSLAPEAAQRFLQPPTS